MGEGDAHGGRLERGMGTAIVEGIFSILRIEGIHQAVELFPPRVLPEEGQGAVGLMEEMEEGDAYLERFPVPVRVALPEEIENAEEFEGVLGFQKGHLIPPFDLIQIGQTEMECGGVVAHFPQAHGGLLGEPVEDRISQFRRALLRGQDMGVTDGRAPGLGQIDFLSPQPVIHPLSLNTSPDPAEVALGGGAKLLDGGDPTFPQPRFHLPPDPAKVGELELVKAAGQIGLIDENQTIGLFQFRRRFGQVRIGSHPDRAAEVGPGLPGNRLFDFPGQSPGFFRRLPVDRKRPHHFVYGKNLVHMKAALDQIHQLMMPLDINLMARLDELDIRAQFTGIGNPRSCFDSIPFGLIAGGNAAGAVRQHGNDAHGLITQLRSLLLLDGSEVGIKIQKETPQGHEIILEAV